MSVLEAIGDTPMVELRQLAPSTGVRLFAKLEGNNPAGSVKDRPAFAMINGAVERGTLNRGDRLVEATSGNTGIALAMIAPRFGVTLTLLMPDDATDERVRLMRAYGAEVLLTPAEKTIEYSRREAERMAREEGFVLLDQFANPDNPRAHEQTTGPEIWRATGGDITHFVSAMGTTGTIMGVSRYLKTKQPAVQIVGTQPSGGASIPGIRRWSPEYVPAIFDSTNVDAILDVSRDEAVAATRRLAEEEGILGGMSSGGALAAALRVAQELEGKGEPGVVVFVVCDRGDRYLSSDLFA